MTIASHCLALIRERGPLSAEELGAACREAGATAARAPAQSVTTALSWNQDGRALLVRDRYHAVTDLLEGRWLTFAAPVDDPWGAHPNVDLACLSGVVEREGLPLAGGGTVTAQRYSHGSWQWPEGSLPAGETLGLRLTGGTAQVSAVVLDDDAKRRGERLVELLTEGNRPRSYGYVDRREAAGRGWSPCWPSTTTSFANQCRR